VAQLVRESLDLGFGDEPLEGLVVFGFDDVEQLEECVGILRETARELGELAPFVDIEDRFGVDRAMADPCGCAVSLAIEAVAGLD
jgi:hypothetical protein